jgi:hypothetical protein
MLLRKKLSSLTALHLLKSFSQPGFRDSFVALFSPAFELFAVDWALRKPWC